MPLPCDDKGTLLVADLTEKKTQIKQIPRDIHRKYHLGLGYNTWLLNQKTSPYTKPFGAENIVIISPGLLTGTDAPASSRVEVTTKSPLTGLIGTGNSGGHWGPRLKKAGYDALMIKGASKKPVYLSIQASQTPHFGVLSDRQRSSWVQVPRRSPKMNPRVLSKTNDWLMRVGYGFRVFSTASILQ